MTDKQNLIRNPLTVIAVFAGVAETSGAACLPFLVPAVQETYVWFLILFPPLLVALFFATLNWNHRVLYAPSDYRDERNFMGFDPAEPAQLLVKLQDEVTQQQSEPSEAPPTPEITDLGEQATSTLQPPPLGTDITSSARDVFVLSEFAIAKLSRDFKLRLLRNQSPRGMSDVVFDAVADDGTDTTIVEVLHLSRGGNRQAARNVLKYIRRYWETLSSEEQSRFALIFVGATFDQLATSEKAKAFHDIKAMTMNEPFRCTIKIYDKDDLDMGVFG